MTHAPPSPSTRILRGLGRRCPNCGGGGIFATYWRMRERCPTCGLRLERGEHGYQVGTYMFNLIFAELVFVGVFVAIVTATWPDPPWDALRVGAGVGMIAMPFLFYPFSKGLFLAFDLIWRPPAPDELA